MEIFVNYINEKCKCRVLQSEMLVINRKCNGIYELGSIYSLWTNSIVHQGIINQGHVMANENSSVASVDVSRLRDARIKVITGVEEERCRKIREVYIH